MTSNLQQMFNNALTQSGLLYGLTKNATSQLADNALAAESEKAVKDADEQSKKAIHQSSAAAYGYTTTPKTKEERMSQESEYLQRSGEVKQKALEAAEALKAKDPNFGFYTRTGTQTAFGTMNAPYTYEKGIGNVPFDKYQEREATLKAQKLYFEGRKKMLKEVRNGQ